MKLCHGITITNPDLASACFVAFAFTHRRHIGDSRLEQGKLRTILDPAGSWYLDKVRGEARYASILLNFKAWQPPGLVALRLRANHEATPTKVGIRSRGTRDKPRGALLTRSLKAEMLQSSCTLSGDSQIAAFALAHFSTNR